MRFVEIDFFGVYVAPIALILVAGALAFAVLRRATDRFGLLRRVWHPALFEIAVYAILVSSLTIFVAYRGR
jgi:protein AaeX